MPVSKSTILNTIRFSNLRRGYSPQIIRRPSTIGLGKASLNEGWRGSPKFDVQFYLNNNGDLKAAFGTSYSAALDHWINHGISEVSRVCHDKKGPTQGIKWACNDYALLIRKIATRLQGNSVAQEEQRYS